MIRPRILLDVDGPLTMGFLDRACEILRMHGIDAVSEKCRAWDIYKAFEVPPSIKEKVLSGLSEEGVSALFDPRPGMRSFVSWLQSFADVYACTSPLANSPTWAYDRACWLEREAGITATHIISCDDKSVVSGDVLVDDKPEHLIAWQATNPSGLAVLWVERYNEASNWRGARVSSYADLERFLGRFVP